MKVEAGFGETWLADVPAQVRWAESVGFDAITTGEVKHHSLLSMTLAAEHTQRLEICSAVTIVFPRSPMIMAQAGWDLQEFSKGRINLGFGSQVKGHNLRRFSSPWPGSAGPRMRDYINMVRAVWESWQHGAKPQFTSEFYSYTLMTPNFDPGPLPYPFPKITMANVGPVMARIAGEVADGLRPHGFMTEKHMRESILPAVDKGLEKSGRRRADMDISTGGFLVLAETQSEVEQAVAAMRKPISFYGSTRTYHGVFRTHELESLGMQLHEMSLRGEWDKMPAAVPLSVAEEMVNHCTYDEFPAFARTHFDYADRVNIGAFVGRRPQSARRPAAPGSPEGLPLMSDERARWMIDELRKIPSKR